MQALKKAHDYYQIRKSFKVDYLLIELLQDWFVWMITGESKINRTDHLLLIERLFQNKNLFEVNTKHFKYNNFKLISYSFLWGRDILSLLFQNLIIFKIILI